MSADVGFNLEFADGKIAKQYGYDSEGCFYYDTAGEEKVRIEGATANDYETYTYILADNTKITDIVIGNHITPELQASYIEFYASNDPNPDNLYSEDNLIAVYDKNNWISSNVIGASFSFTEGITASFVGMRVMDYLTGNRVGDQSGYAGVRMFKFDIYGVSTTALKSVYVAYENHYFSSVEPKTTVDDTTNYSIPKALYEKDSTFNITQVYYRNNYPNEVTSANGTALWNRSHDSTYRGIGTKTYNKTLVCEKTAHKHGTDCADATTCTVEEHTHNGYCYTFDIYEDCWTDVFYDFGDIYNINEIVYGAHNNIDLRAVDFTFYIGNDLLTLFTEANQVKSFKNSYGYISLQFGEGTSGRYVGVRFRDTAKNSAAYPANDYLRLSEINVFGSLKETVRDADVTNYKGNTALTALADTTGKASLVKEFPAIRRVNTKTGEVVNHTQTLKNIEYLFNNATATVNFTELAHVDENGKAADFGTYYTEIFYDLEKQEEITDILLVSSNGWNRAGFYDVFVSDDENIEASEKIASVQNYDNGNNTANLLTMPEGTVGRYVSVRYYAPTAGASKASDNYVVLQELEIFGKTGYSIEGKEYVSKQSYFNTYADMLATSLIADKQMYATENIKYFNIGTANGGTFTPGSEGWEKYNYIYAAKEFVAGDSD